MFHQEMQRSIEYLSSSEAEQSLKRDPYWPKWDSPWWHMLVLQEMGEAHRIPPSAIEALIHALNAYPLKTFPIHHGDLPQGIDPWRGTSCHCAVGNVYKILSDCGTNVDERVPWLRPWMLRYQMADGGLNCDNEAYLVHEECPSSMVGTIPPFETILQHTPREWTPDEISFLDRAAAFLMSRKLLLGSPTKHNASERIEAAAWTKLCFPRLYFYDALRGLAVLLEWSERRAKHVPWECIREAVELLEKKGGQIERFSFEGCTTLQHTASGEWLGKQPATFFPLLSSTSALGASPFLEKQWTEAKARLERLKKAGLVS